MKRKSVLVWMGFLLILCSLAFSQSKETGAITGTVLDEQNEPLPGATVTITSPNLMGSRESVADAQGQYRFPALPPGEYTVKAQLQGFATSVQRVIRLTTTTRLTIDLVLKPSAVEEEVTVVAQSPTVDIKSTETASVTMTNEMLRNIPNVSNFSSSLVNMAPGVTPDNMADSAYGASDGTGIAYSMDGVNVSDPEGGTAWVFIDNNIIEEAKVMGIGLPAEYGNFTGVIFNIVTKSGGNEFSGHMEFDYQGERNDKPAGLWQKDNIQAYLNDFPEQSSPRYKLIDVNAHLGGPIKKDKIWFYEGLQFQRFEDYAAGFPKPRAYNQPRSFTKITAQLTPSTNMLFGLEIDRYNGENRGAASYRSVDAVLNQTSPEIVGNFSLTHILSPKTFIDVKAAYFWGYYYLEPKTGRGVYAHQDSNANMLLYNRGNYYLADRTRLQANASLTHYAEDFIKGSHDFKFGVEVERSTCRSQFGYTGKGGPLGDNIYYYDYVGYAYNLAGNYVYFNGPYLAYQYEGYDFNSPYTRLEGFVQDSWQITPRLNINAGLRLSQNWGQSEGQGTVWNTHRIAPRIGLTFDIFGDKKTIFKAHYGQFTEGMFANFHSRLSKKWFDYISYKWDPETKEWQEFERVKQNWKLQDGIKHPYMNQFTFSLERELFRDASVSVSYINRDWKNIIGVYDTLAVYEPINYDVSRIGKSFTVYELISGNAHEYVIENIKPGSNRPYYRDDPYRTYRGLEFLFNKRFSNKWQLLLSFVYSQAKGTIDNEQQADTGWQQWATNGGITGDPNFWINADGHNTYDPTYLLKIAGTYVLPLDISLSASFRAVTGTAWAQRFRTRTLNQGRVTFYTQPRGSQHYDMQKVLDLRLEKIFTLARKYRLGVLVDVFNVLNADTIDDWGTRIGYDWENDTASPDYFQSTQGHDLYSIIYPRQVRLGIRLIF
jgi:hypothetical protein